MRSNLKKDEKRLHFLIDFIIKLRYTISCSDEEQASMAQLVARLTRNEKVEGSSPFRSSFRPVFQTGFFVIQKRNSFRRALLWTSTAFLRMRIDVIVESSYDI